MMDAKQKALAQIQAWNAGNVGKPGLSWGAVDAPVSTKKKGRGGFLSSLISEAGGAGGAAAGAAGGAAIGSVVPGLGTLIGGIIGAGVGGFAGGTAGRGVENKVRDNQNFFGKGGSAKTAFGEGALSGALSAAIPGASAGFKGAAKAIKGAGTLDKLAAETGTTLQQGAKTGILEGAGAQMKASAGGYGIGAKLGANNISANESKAIGNTLKELRIGASSPEKMSAEIGTARTNLENILQNQYQNANSTLSKSEITQLQKRISARIGKEVGAPDQKFIGNQMRNLQASKDTTGVWSFNKNLGKFTNYGANSEGKLVDREAAARIMKDETRKFLNAKVPGAAKTNSLYHNATKAEQLTLKQAADVKGGGAISKVLNLSPVRAAESKLGSAVEGVGKVSAGTGGALTKVTQQAKFQAPGNLYQAMASPTNPTQDPTMQDSNQSGVYQTNPDGSYSPTSAGNVNDTFTMPQAQQQQPTQSPYPIEAMMADIQRDPKHATQYESLFKTISSASGSAGGGKDNVGVVSSQNYGNAQSGYQALQELGALLQQEPGVLNKTRVPGRGLDILGIGGTISNAAGTGQYDALAFNIADKYLRLTTGAQANESEVKNVMSKIMPRAGDSQTTVQTKLNNLMNFFGTTLQQAGTSSNSNNSSSLSSLLAQGGL